MPTSKSSSTTPTSARSWTCVAVRLGLLGQELEGDEADDEVADDGRQPDPTGGIPEHGRGQEDGAELQDGDGRGFHGRQPTG